MIIELEKLQACSAAIEWAKTQPDLKTAWQNCERGDWMIWLVFRVSGDGESPERKKAVLTLCDCVTANMVGPSKALDILKDWAKEGNILVRPTNCATNISRIFDAAFSFSAANAADDASAATHATPDTAYEQKTVDTIRKHYLEPPDILKTLRYV